MKNCKELLAENRAWADRKMSKVTTRPPKPIRPSSWVAGFWGGTNALLYEATKNEDYLKSAKEREALPEDEGGVYMHAAIKMLHAIAEKFADFDPETDEMILGGSTRYPVPGKYTMEQSGVHIHLVYSDFYFTEGILKLLGSEFNPW